VAVVVKEEELRLAEQVALAVVMVVLLTLLETALQMQHLLVQAVAVVLVTAQMDLAVLL
jgi:hypothetical protein